MQLYLNLATDRTFLFRDGQVSIEARVDGDRISAAMARVEERLRANRRFVPRYSELAYVRRHFEDLLQGDLPCAESQLKVMVHSTGEIGGCWGHDAKVDVRDTPVAEILESRGLPRGARAVLPQGVRRVRQQLRAEPGVAAEHVRRGRAVAPGPTPAGAGERGMRSSAPLYDRLAPTYDEHFAVAHRRAYDELAWEICAAALPEPPAVVVDVGCGVGRWAERLLSAGYTVTGIEPAPGMADHAARRSGRRRGAVTLLRSRVEDVELPPPRSDASWRWAPSSTPRTRPRRSPAWPGGCVPAGSSPCSSTACRRWCSSWSPRAGRRRRQPGSPRGAGCGASTASRPTCTCWTQRRCAGRTPRPAWRSSGVAGLLVGATAYGRDGLPRRLKGDFAGALAVERRLAAQPDLADLGKQLLIVGRRPSRRAHRAPTRRRARPRRR